MPHKDPKTKIFGVDPIGNFRHYFIYDPAANTEWSIRVPRGKVWIVHSIVFRFITDVTAANRRPSVEYRLGGTVFFFAVPIVSHTASLNRIYCYANFGTTIATDTGAGYNVPLPPIPLHSGVEIGSLTTSIQATDNIGNVVLYVEEWDE